MTDRPGFDRARPMAHLNLKLKFTILARGFRSQGEFANHVRVSERRMSDIVRGWVTPSAEERATIAKALNRPESYLFKHVKAEEVGI
jgi:transcriptional regulator with XRE-family HTH domain